MIHGFKRIFSALFGVVLLCIFQCFISQVAYAATLSNDFKELYLNANINNHLGRNIYTILQDRHGNIYVSGNALSAWDVAPPKIRPIIYQNALYYPLKSFSRIKYSINYSTQTINLMIPAKYLIATVIGNQKLQNIQRPDPGGFINYDLFGYSEDKKLQSNNYFELGYFNKHGLGTSSFLVGSDSANWNDDDWFGKTHSTVTRLLTNWTYDNPDKMTRLRLGDDNSTAANWGNSVYFGGVHYGTDFDTQPNFIRYPLPSMNGIATLPTATDLYVNGALKKQARFRPGPYIINNIPVVDGAGNIKLVTTDLLGRQQVVTTSFYNSNTNLKPGLVDFAVDAGFVRRNYGTRSNDYGDFMVNANRRVGITNKLTDEYHAELLTQQQTIGYGINYVVGTFGLLNSSLALSNAQHRGIGGLFDVGFERHTQTYIFSLQNEFDTSHFKDLGMGDSYVPPRVTSRASVGFPVLKGTLGFTYFYELNRGNNPNTQIFSTSYMKTFHRNIFFTFAASRTVGQNHANNVYAGIIVLLDDRTSATASSNKQNNSWQQSLSLTKSLPVGDGYGYHLETGIGNNSIQQGSLSYRNNYATYMAAIYNYQDKQRYSLNVNGAVAILHGLHFMNQIDNGFAVVKVPGYQNIRVYANHGLISKTDKHGEVFVNNLPPYYKSSISIDMRDLPLNAKVDADERFVSAFPQSGYLINFPVQLSTTGSVTLLQSSGKPVPEGALVNVVSPHKVANETMVGADGLAYLTNLSTQNHLKIYWKDKECDLTLFVPKGNMQQQINDFGRHICKLTSSLL